MSIRIHHLNCGTMCPLCERLVQGHGRWTRPGRLVCHCLLIETPEALVLVDTGLGLQDVQDARRRLGPAFPKLARPQLVPAEAAIEQVRALGHDPRDVRHIIATHVDLDHVGGLSDFPHAQVHLFEPELQQVLQPTPRDARRFRLVQFDHRPQWVAHRQTGERWFGFGGIRALPGVSADILLVPLIGHTHGHCGVAVRQGPRWLLHCGDAYYHYSQVGARPRPPLLLKAMEAAVQYLPRQRVENQARLRELALQHGDEVELFCAHDPTEYARYAGSPT